MLFCIQAWCPYMIKYIELHKVHQATKMVHNMKYHAYDYGQRHLINTDILLDV